MGNLFDCWNNIAEATFLGNRRVILTKKKFFVDFTF